MSVPWRFIISLVVVLVDVGVEQAGAVRTVWPALTVGVWMFRERSVAFSF